MQINHLKIKYDQELRSSEISRKHVLKTTKILEKCKESTENFLFQIAENVKKNMKKCQAAVIV